MPHQYPGIPPCPIQGNGGSDRRRRLGAGLLGLTVAALLCLGRAQAYEQGPSWTIGHGQVIARTASPGGRRALYLRVSLRNMGTPGRQPVTVYGRWQRRSRSTQAGHRPARRAGTTRTGEQYPWRPDMDRQKSVVSHRWQMPGNVQRAAMPTRIGSGMRILGRYQREVSLVSTAILEIPLQALGPPRPDARGLELEIMTAARVTGQGFVPIDTN